MLVSNIKPGYIEAAGWTIPTHTVVWAAGMRGCPLLESLGTPLDRMGRAIVEPDCTIPGFPEVFVIGDAAHFEDPAQGILPGVAPTAMQMGRYVARTIAGDLKGRPRAPFRYFDKGQLAVIGRGQAVAEHLEAPLLRLHRLAHLGLRPHRLPHRLQESRARHAAVGLVVLQLRARRPPHHRHRTAAHHQRTLLGASRSPRMSTPPAPVVSIDELKAYALSLGFVACGIADLSPTPHGDVLDRWLAAGLRRRHALHQPAGEEAEGPQAHRSTGQVSGCYY